MSDEQISIEELDCEAEIDYDPYNKSGYHRKYYRSISATAYDIRVENGEAICYTSDYSKEVSAYIDRPDISTLDDLRKTVAGLLESMKDRVMRLRELEVAVWKATVLWVIDEHGILGLADLKEKAQTLHSLKQEDEDEDEDEEESA